MRFGAPSDGPFATAPILDRLAATFALADPRARSLLELCGKPRDELPLSPQDWLKDEDTPPLQRHNLRFYYGRWLSQPATL